MPLLFACLGTPNAPVVQTHTGKSVMRAVIFAVAVLTGATGWLLFETPGPAVQQPVAELVQPNAASVRGQYRAERARCKLAEAAERASCERRLRDRIHARLRQEGAKISFR